MWFQAAECNAVNASLLLNLIKNNFPIFYLRIFPFWIPLYLLQKSEMCHPILVNLLKMRPHYSQSSRENATPSSETSLLASCRGVPLPPGVWFNMLIWWIMMNQFGDWLIDWLIDWLSCPYDVWLYSIQSVVLLIDLSVIDCLFHTYFKLSIICLFLSVLRFDWAGHFIKAKLKQSY